MKIKIKILIFCISMFLLSHSYAKSDNPFAVTAYGNFAQMMATGNADSHVLLQTIQNQKTLYGLGAMTGLHGEIIIFDGNVYISPGTAADGSTEQIELPQNAATMLVTAKVKRWQDIKIHKNMSAKQFQAFVLQKATALGIQNDVPFPFMIKGNFKDLEWHVVAELKPTSADKKAYPIKKQFSAAAANGLLLGFYTGSKLEGIVSHPGNPFHIHYADKDIKHSGHVDHYAVEAGAILLLPKLSQ